MKPDNTQSRGVHRVQGSLVSACSAPLRAISSICAASVILAVTFSCKTSIADKPQSFLKTHCFECHDELTQEGGLDLTALPLALNDRDSFAKWTRIHDRVRDGEMPPDGSLTATETKPFVETLAKKLIAVDRARIRQRGRAVVRRMNRHEYENTIRDLLDAPWLQLADRLPEDGTAYGFNRSGEALDVAHVQMARYLEAADYALREVLVESKQRPKVTTTRYYTRDQLRFVSTMNLGGPAMRHPFPVFKGEADNRFTELLKELNTSRKRNGRHKTVLNSQSTVQRREHEAIGVVVSTYEPTQIRFNNFVAPVSGRYRLRLRAYSIWVKGNTVWVEADPKWGLMERARRTLPDFTQVSRGRRGEPVTLYSDASPGVLRKLGSFDVTSDPATHEMDAWLLADETIRPDAARLFRLRGAHPINPLAEEDDGMPGVAFQWLEVEGPIYDQWPPAGHQLLFDDLELANPGSQPDRLPEFVTNHPVEETRRLMSRFLQRAYRHPVDDAEVTRFAGIVDRLRTDGATFTEALLGGYKAVLCSPGFLFLHQQPGVLSDDALACRLSYFLTDSAPDATLRQLARRRELHQVNVLREQTRRLLDSPKSRRFIVSFLDYWLDLRRIAATTPDGSLYPDYQLDDLLVESMTGETRAFVSHLVANNMPARNLISADFAILNERLATHYGISEVEGVALRRVELPNGSSRGGLMTQASVLKVTSDGTTTSPVLRGNWIADRLLGIHVPPPPENVGAVEPDTRGASTIREILDKHRNIESCAVCHRVIDPYGFALEGFDVMGAERRRYRAVGGTPLKGGGHNGRPFEFHYALATETKGSLPGNVPFADVRELKLLLLENEDRIARNVLEHLIVYATGAPVGFFDREELEVMLSRARQSQYGLRTLIHEVIQSRMFRNK